MEIKLHANATTTPRIRRYLQQSDKSDRELSLELGISITTVRRWRNREHISDNHTTPKVIHKAMRQEQVALINALRDATGAPLDELLLLVNDGLGINVSRATLNRYLKAAVTARQGAPLKGLKAIKAGRRPDHLKLHHLSFSLHMDDGGEQHLLWAREPISGWCFARVYAGISPQLLKNWTRELLKACPVEIQSIETFGFESPFIPDGIALTIGRAKQNAVQVTARLVEIIPRIQAEPVECLLEKMCEFYNEGKTQKKLGDRTPQAFLEALRRQD
ncbi:hypothetical protein D3C80_681790 [compost metagenome]